MRNILLSAAILFLFPGIGCADSGVAKLNTQPQDVRHTLVQQGNLKYLGAFRVPRGNLGGDSSYPQSLARGGAGLTYNSVNNSLIMISRSRGIKAEKLVVELNIPVPKKTEAISELNTATLLQAPGNVANNQWSNLKLNDEAVGNGGRPGGLLVYNNKLIGSSYAYYDGPSEAARSHFAASLKWATEGSQFSGMYRVGVSPLGPDKANGGFVGGYMTHIPKEWQAKLGYPALTGKGAIAVITRSSLGPSAWGFDPDNLGKVDPVPSTFLVGYPGSHPTLGSYGDKPSLLYNRVTELNGLVFPENSSSLLFFGRHGLGLTGEGDTCYGTGTRKKDLAGTPDGQGNKYCYDPADGSKGVHGYPYIAQVWAYDANDLVEVKNGKQEPWNVIPYARWQLPLPYETDMNTIEGVAYDPATQRVFVAQSDSDRVSNPYEPYPIIHVFKVVLE